jgi:cyclic pyranopterin phosphate synthase
METRKRLHVKVSRECNNNCLFCLDDRDLRADVTTEEVQRLLDAHRRLGDMLFTCGEPTIHPDLPLFVQMARTEGYHSIGLVTNGRRLAYPDYLESLLAFGLNEITISIHGCSARMHDAVTRTKGSFGQTTRGLQNVHRARERYDLRLITSTVVTSRNLGHVGEILYFLASFYPDTMVLNVVEPSGEALSHFDRLIPEYEDVAAAIRAALEGFHARDAVVVEGIPVCLCTGFEQNAGLREEIHLQEGEELKTLPPDRNHAKPEFCDGCRYTHVCPGVFVEYLERRGWKGPDR